tara:strand:- start:4701 stop:4979 length:279 start_codon:yes stop_codon:yes gene_type:complete
MKLTVKCNNTNTSILKVKCGLAMIHTTLSETNKETVMMYTIGDVLEETTDTVLKDKFTKDLVVLMNNEPSSNHLYLRLPKLRGDYHIYLGVH